MSYIPTHGIRLLWYQPIDGEWAKGVVLDRNCVNVRYLWPVMGRSQLSTFMYLVQTLKGRGWFFLQMFFSLYYSENVDNCEWPLSTVFCRGYIILQKLNEYYRRCKVHHECLCYSTYIIKMQLNFFVRFQYFLTEIYACWLLTLFPCWSNFQCRASIYMYKVTWNKRLYKVRPMHSVMLTLEKSAHARTHTHARLHLHTHTPQGHS